MNEQAEVIGYLSQTLSMLSRRRHADKQTYKKSTRDRELAEISMVVAA